jgi:hypothetical protein
VHSELETVGPNTSWAGSLRVETGEASGHGIQGMRVVAVDQFPASSGAGRWLGSSTAAPECREPISVATEGGGSPSLVLYGRGEVTRTGGEVSEQQDIGGML